jgi:hypothetical protein
VCTTSTLFTIQQATEKYLKAVLLGFGAATSESELRTQYGHKIRELFAASLCVAATLAPLEKHLDLLEYDASVRYQAPKLGANEVVARLNLSYGICHAAARSLLRLRTVSNGSQ